MAAVVVTASLIMMAMVWIIVWKLTMAFLREYKLLKGVKNEIAYLKGEISSMNAIVVNMDGMEELDIQQKEWKVKLRELSFAMEECTDMFKYHRAEGEGKAGFVDQLKALRVRHTIAKKIQKLKARLADAERYRLNNEYVAIPNEPSIVTIDPRLSALYEEGAGLVGIAFSKHEIIRWLMEGGSGASPRIRALSIVGCSGIGKSTLAEEVYHGIRDQFDCSVFVSSACRRQSTKWILEEMLSGLGFQGNTKPRDTQYQLIDKLKEYLKEKRCLIVIDDIWSEEAWNDISCALLESNHRSRVVMTTRHHNVASACLQAPRFRGRVYEIKPLNDADSRRLFCRRVFDFTGHCPVHLRDTLEPIVKKCGGVPLVILSLAGTLANRNVMLTENWDEILSSLAYGLDRNPGIETVRYLLDLSYRGLCPNLRNCMLYLGMHPEYTIISKDYLVRRWIAEGFVSKAYGYTQEEVAESYFNQLINLSIIQVADFNEQGQAISCQVHDMMLDFILSKAMEENFFAIVDAQQSIGESKEIRRVYFHVDHTECERVILSMDLSRARTLDFWACSKCQPSLSKFLLLRVLHLDISYSRNEFLVCDLTILCKLYLLRYLKITSSLGSVSSGFVRRTCRLPRQIRTLRHLKTLDVDANLLGFPEDICEVTSLSNMIVSSCPPPWLPNGIGGLRALQILKGFSAHCFSVNNIQSLGELTDLRELEVYVDATEDAQVAVANSIHRLNRLQSLVIHCSGTKSRSSNFGHHLRYWFPPRGLQRLHFHGCFFDSVPHWMAQLDKLTSLILAVAKLSSAKLDVLAGLPSLVHLRLSIGEFVVPQGVLWATSLPEAKILIRRGMFSCLKSFWFRYEVPCDLVFEPGAMRSLESLVIRFVVERAVPSAPVLSGIQHLENLRSCTVRIDSSSSDKRAFIINMYNPAVSHIWSPQEYLWWAYYVRSAEVALRNAMSPCYRTRPLLVHIKYGGEM